MMSRRSGVTGTQPAKNHNFEPNHRHYDREWWVDEGDDNDEKT